MCLNSQQQTNKVTKNDLKMFFENPANYTTMYSEHFQRFNPLTVNVPLTYVRGTLTVKGLREADCKKSSVWLLS